MFKLFRKKAQKKVLWTDTQIDLYERQIAAREAMGPRYSCHPLNAQGPLMRVKLREGEEFVFNGPRRGLRLVK